VARRNHCVEAVLQELTRHGIAAQVQQTNSNHYAVLWTGPNGRKRRQVLAGTTSNREAMWNARAFTRRTLREDGVAR
jgi:hypothetical protein